MKRFEFSYVDDSKEMHFVTVFDEDIFSACERVLGRNVEADELKTSHSNNYFVTGWTDTNFTVHVQDYKCEQSSHVRYTPQAKVNPILEGLI